MTLTPQQLQAKLYKARLDEAKWQLAHLIDPWAFRDSDVGRGPRKRITHLRQRLAGYEEMKP